MNFNMVGKISIGRATDKFTPYDEKTYDSGWVNRTLRFNAICGDNRHMLQVRGGKFADDHGDVYLFSKGSIGEDGKRIKGESFTIPFKERLTSKRLAEVAEFRKFVFDLEKPHRRQLLQNFADKIKNGEAVTDEELKSVGLTSESEIAEALVKSQKKHHEFVTEWDFAEFIKKVIDSDKYTDAMFTIRGDAEYQYSENNQQVYETYVPKRIYLADPDATPSSKADLTLIFGADAVDDMSVDEKGKYYVSAYHMEYDNNRRANIPVPVTMSIPVADENADDKSKARVRAIKRKFTVDDDKFYEYGVVVDMLNGAQRVEIDESMLTDEQKDDLECGLITMEDIRRDLGSSVYGERIREYQFAAVGRGYTKGRNDTVYTADDMVIKPIEVDDETIDGPESDPVFGDDEL